MANKIIVVKFTYGADVPLVEYLKNRSTGLSKFFEKWGNIYISVDNDLEYKINGILVRMEKDLKALNKGNHYYELTHLSFMDCVKRKPVNFIRRYVLMKDNRRFSEISFDELEEIKIE